MIGAVPPSKSKQGERRIKGRKRKGGKEGRREIVETSTVVAEGLWRSLDDRRSGSTFLQIESRGGKESERKRKREKGWEGRRGTRWRPWWWLLKG